VSTTKSHKRKLTVAIAGIAALVTIGASSIAYAMWLSQREATATGASAETFEDITVGAEWVGRAGGGASLLPGESGDVRITFNNPNNTVQGKVISVTPSSLNGFSVTGFESGLSDDQKHYCASLIQLKTYTPQGAAIPVLGTGTANNPRQITLVNAVTLHPETPRYCSGMDFSTKWNVTVEATRQDVNGVATLS
jgi:hypothetical protein